MQTIYKLKATEMDINFVETIKLLFKDKPIEISIREVKENQPVKTFYQAIEHFRQKVTPADLEPDDQPFEGLHDASTGREVSL